jgi:hypothetical protein
MDKCVKCHFYDRKNSRSADGRVTMWGQCRRHSPMLNPLNAKPYAIEGVWPTIRDDDWCGEWRAEVEHAVERSAEVINGNSSTHRPKVTALTTGASASAGDD